MKKLTIKGETRNELGKKSTKQLRYEKKVPCIVYGNGENIHFASLESNLKKLIYTPNSYIVNLEIEGKAEAAILKDIQFHPVKDKILHVDFYRIDLKKPVEILTPLKVNGLAIGVKNGGQLIIPMRKIMVRAMLNDLPDFLEIDVTDLDIGDSLRIKDLSFDNIELTDRKINVVAAVKMTRAAISEESTIEEGEEGEGEEGEGEEGEKGEKGKEGTEDKKGKKEETPSE